MSGFAVKSRIHLVGLAFWQAWWMLAMCSGLLAGGPGAARSEAGLIMGVTALGYGVVTLVFRNKGELRVQKSAWVLAGVCACGGTLGMCLFVPDGGVGFLMFCESVCAFSLGNALLLMMWGEVWSQLPTGRVTLGLVGSYAAAFVVYFALELAPRDIALLSMSALPMLSLAALRGSADEPRRSRAQVQYEAQHVPTARVLLAVALLSAVWGATESVFPSLAGENGTSMEASFAFTGVLMVVALVDLLALPPSNEPKALYRVVVPSMSVGLLLMAFDPTTFWTAGNGLLMFGIYVLDMLMMLVSTDMAFRSQKPVVLVFGTVIFAARASSFAGHAFGQALFQTVGLAPGSVMRLLLAGAIATVVAGGIVFPEGTLARLYQVRRTVVESRGLKEQCELVSSECGLTQRESEVLFLLACGRSIPYIADDLSIAQGTAKHHVSNIYRKIGVCDRQGLHDVVEQRNVRP